MDNLLTVAEAAALLRISRSSTYRLMQHGELHYVYPVGRTRRVKRSEIDTFIAGMDMIG